MFSNITKTLHCLALILLQPRASTADARALGCRAWNEQLFQTCYVIGSRLVRHMVE